jgi:hypothetical protein
MPKRPTDSRLKRGWVRVQEIQEMTPPTRFWSEGGVCGCKYGPPARVCSEGGSMGLVTRRYGPPTRSCCEGGSVGLLMRKYGPPTRSCSEGGSVGLTTCEIYIYISKNQKRRKLNIPGPKRLVVWAPLLLTNLSAPSFCAVCCGGGVRVFRHLSFVRDVASFVVVVVVVERESELGVVTVTLT